MPGSVTAASDAGSQYRDFIRERINYRPLAGVTYLPGSILQFASLDLQTFSDAKAVGITPITANPNKLAGVVSEIWPGFAGSAVANSFVAPSNTFLVRGTQMVDTVIRGYHPSVLVDQSGTGAVTLVDGNPIIPSRATAGYGQGIAAATSTGPTGTIGSVALPATGIGSSLPAAALAQAAQTSTIATPAAGDAPFVTIQAPYSTTVPGVVQTITFQMPALTTAQAASATTAAAAFAAYLNTQANYTKYFIATSAAGVVTHTVNANSTLFKVNFGTGSYEANSFNISISGAVGNSLTFASGVVGTGGTTNTAGGATFAGGTGYKGYVPAWLSCST